MQAKNPGAQFHPANSHRDCIPKTLASQLHYDMNNTTNFNVSALFRRLHIRVELGLPQGQDGVSGLFGMTVIFMWKSLAGPSAKLCVVHNSGQHPPHI
ncbi:hypothetical protein Ddc_14333 [Ditylenchus destructor]|nr:hypothetical protein Ddc_14333 [Ditylenchus destructor]